MLHLLSISRAGSHVFGLTLKTKPPPLAPPRPPSPPLVHHLQARFDRFGPVKACRIVMDKTTGKPKGTAFIEFKTPDPAAAAAAASTRAREGKGPDVTVKGVTLSVDLALTQDDARRLGVERGGAAVVQGSVGPGGKFDRRNLYLSKEGFVEEGSTVWMAMSENDRCVTCAGHTAGVEWPMMQRLNPQNKTCPLGGDGMAGLPQQQQQCTLCVTPACVSDTHHKGYLCRLPCCLCVIVA